MRRRAACVTFEHWTDARATSENVVDITKTAAYVPGEFFRRELPCVLAVLDELSEVPDVVLVDGYVWLDACGRKGLGGHWFDGLGESVPVIGVAKTRFATAASAAGVFRGSSRRPLFVTAAGMDECEAADCIRRMHGENRIPTMLKRADQLSHNKIGSE